MSEEKLPDECCGRCRHSLGTNQTATRGVLTCRRYPPVPVLLATVPEPLFSNQWPGVILTECCGEFEPPECPN